jgi:ribonuclease R
MTNKKQNSKSTHSLEDRIVALLRQPGMPALAISEVAAQLKLHGKDRKRLAHVLRRLYATGHIGAKGGNRYTAVQKRDVTEGRIVIARSGDGFIDRDDAESIRVFSRDLGTALPGDTVAVETSTRDGMTAGRVVRIVQRADHHVLGTVKTTGRVQYVVPMSPSYPRNFRVPDTRGAKLDDRVVVALVAWDDRNLDPEGKILEVIGPASDPSLDTVGVMRQYGFDDEFPARVVTECNALVKLIDEPGERMDLRKKFIFTIDPVSARDFDDALSLEQDEHGQRVLGVHIADVSHFVRPGSVTDKEALRRGNSVYFPDKVIPMLPKMISNGVCSLVPDEDRLAFSVFMTVDKDGNHLRTEFARSIIRSKLRLSYEQALEALDLPDGKDYPNAGMTKKDVSLLKTVGKLSQQMRSGRYSRHALELDVPEYKVVLADDGSVADIRESSTDAAHQLVEECMIAANEAVDRDLSERKVPIIHRIHEPPKDEKIEKLTLTLREMGFHPKNLHDRRNIAKVLAEAADSPLLHDIRVAVLRSMNRALYSEKGLGHYGLAKKYYAHFTSPIRRYPDLVVHRILAEVLLSGKSGQGKPQLAAMSGDCSITEREAEDAERTLIEIKKYRYLEQELATGKPEAHEGVVVNVKPFGMFVELTELRLSGLVHISTISRGHTKYNPTKGTLHAGKQLYAVGSLVKVHVTKIDFEQRQIDLALCK